MTDYAFLAIVLSVLYLVLGTRLTNRAIEKRARGTSGDLGFVIIFIWLPGLAALIASLVTFIWLIHS